MRKLNNWIDSYMEYVENTEPPLLYHEWMAVGAISSVLKRKCWLSWGIHDTLYPNLYIVLVGPAGKCRKGTAMGIAQHMLNSLGIRIAPTAITREALIKELSETTESEQTKTGYISHSSLSIWSPEWTVFIGGKDNTTLLMDLTDWYDCADNWTYQTKTQGTNEISGVWVNMIGATTPAQIKSSMSIEAVGGGLVSRIVFVYEDDRHKIVPTPFITPEVRAKGVDLLNDLSKIHLLNGEFTLTQEAMDMYTDWYINMDKTNPDMPPLFDGYINRRQTHLRKLCMVMCAARGDDMTISKDDFNKALDILMRTEVKMPRTFAGVGTARDSQLQESLMMYISNAKTTSVKEIFVDFQGFLTSKRHLMDLLEVLVATGFCSMVLNMTGGHTITYLTNHKMHGRYGKKP